MKKIQPKVILSPQVIIYSLIFTACQRSCGKVMFSLVCIFLSTQGPHVTITDDALVPHCTGPPPPGHQTWTPPPPPCQWTRENPSPHPHPPRNSDMGHPRPRLLQTLDMGPLGPAPLDIRHCKQWNC